MSDYNTDRAWSDRWIPSLRDIIGPHLLIPSTFEQDANQAADLVVLRARDMTIACRVRRPGYATKYPNEFTIRSKRDSGAKTELKKIVDGWGDWMFYGHENGAIISPWWLIDLHAFRAQLIRNRGTIRCGNSSNHDGTYFSWFDVTTFATEPRLLIATSYDRKSVYLGAV